MNIQFSENRYLKFVASPDNSGKGDNAAYLQDNRLQATIQRKFISDANGKDEQGKTSKEQFLSSLQNAITAMGDSVLSKVNQTSADCPYIAYWFKLSQSLSPEQIETNIRRYAPAVQHATTWEQCIEILTKRTQVAFQQNIESGSLEGVPLEVPKDLENNESGLEKVESKADTAQLCCDDDNNAVPPVAVGHGAAAAHAAVPLHPVAAVHVPAAPAPAPFILANYAFSSVHNRKVGSIYFNTGGTHRRIRLTHDSGPIIGRNYPAGEWYFPPVGYDFPPKNAPTLQVDNWLVGTHDGVGQALIPPRLPIPIAPIIGNRVIEYNNGHVNSAGRHKSRGTVQLVPITQQDLNELYDMIHNLHFNDVQLRQGIITRGLSPALRQ